MSARSSHRPPRWARRWQSGPNAHGAGRTTCCQALGTSASVWPWTLHLQTFGSCPRTASPARATSPNIRSPLRALHSFPSTQTRPSLGLVSQMAQVRPMELCPAPNVSSFSSPLTTCVTSASATSSCLPHSHASRRSSLRYIAVYALVDFVPFGPLPSFPQACKGSLHESPSPLATSLYQIRPLVSACSLGFRSNPHLRSLRADKYSAIELYLVLSWLPLSFGGLKSPFTSHIVSFRTTLPAKSCLAGSYCRSMMG